MNDLHLDESALEKLLQNLQHLSIDIARLKPEPDYKGSRGGSCEVQVATLDSGIPTTSKLVAAKKLFFGNRSSEPKRLAFVRRLARELKIWAELCHPHILPLLGFYLGDDYKTAMLLSEYMLYGDLENYIAKMAPTYFERMHLVRDLTDGLAYLHSQTIRHGDLKPGNVLVNPQRRALLADFGLSSSLDAGSSGFTTSNGGAATVRFSSPEILFQGAAGRLLANDIWSWGCLVLGILAEKIPFADLQLDSQIIIAHISHQFPSDVEALALQPPQFHDLVVKCWNGDPNQRPNVTDCLNSIHSALLSLWPPQQELPPQQTPEPTETLSNQPNQILQTPPQTNRQPQSSPANMPIQFHDFFTRAFNGWLAMHRLTLEPPRVDGREVELHKLFLMVGALGGCRAVFEKNLWPVVGAKIGFPYFNGPLWYSKPEVAEQLSKVYLKVLADFEVHWHNSLRPRDPTSIFPLPPQLQYIHPKLESLAIAQFPLQQQEQPRCPLGAGLRQTPQMDQTPNAAQQDEALVQNQLDVAFPPQTREPQPQATVLLLPGLNVHQEQIDEAQLRIRVAIGRFQFKRISNYSSINLSHEQGILLEQSIRHMQSLMIQVARTLVPFVIFAPNDERELNKIAETVVIVSAQTRILDEEPDKRFIFGLGDLNTFRNHLTKFLMRVNGLQSQAIALQNQPNIGVLLPVLLPSAEEQPPTTPLQPPAQVSMRPSTAELPATKPKLPPKLKSIKPTRTSPLAVAAGTSRPKAERILPKRYREDEATGPDGSVGPSGSLKRARTDSRENLERKA